MGTRTVNDFDIKLGEALRITDLTLTKGTLFSEILKILVVGQNSSRMLGVSEIVTPVFKTFKGGKEFGVMDMIIAFRRRE
jgi:hypothetical protein